MEKTKIVSIENVDGSFTDYVLIEHGDGSFTSMTKAEYDRQEAQKLTPMVADK
jgi:hypothetical protein